MAVGGVAAVLSDQLGGAEPLPVTGVAPRAPRVELIFELRVVIGGNRIAPRI